MNTSSPATATESALLQPLSAVDNPSLLGDLARGVPEWEARLLRGAAARDSLSQLTLGMAHELNNLVGGISALSEIYLQGMESGLPLKDGLGLIHNSASRLQVLLRELTGINRRAEGAKDYVNLVETVRSEATVFAHVLPKSLRVETVLPGEEIAALLDETTLRHILLNLVLNLRDAIGHERGAGTLKVQVSRLPDSPPRAELRLTATPAEGQKVPEEPDASNPLWMDARVRLLDARQAALELGGSFEVGADGAMILVLPLIA